MDNRSEQHRRGLPRQGQLEDRRQNHRGQQEDRRQNRGEPEDSQQEGRRQDRRGQQEDRRARQQAGRYPEPPRPRAGARIRGALALRRAPGPSSARVAEIVASGVPLRLTGPDAVTLHVMGNNKTKLSIEVRTPDRLTPKYSCTCSKRRQFCTR